MSIADFLLEKTALAHLMRDVCLFILSQRVKFEGHRLKAHFKVAVHKIAIYFHGD